MVDIDPSYFGGSQPPGVLVKLGDVVPEQVSWLWPGRLPAGKLVVLDGDPSLGKSTLAITFAAHVSTGKAWPDGTDCPLGDVVYMSAEDGLADTLRPRLDAAGGDPARVYALTGVQYPTDDDGGTATRPPTLADVTVLDEAIRRTRARLLVVDVLMAYLPTKADSHRDQDVRAALHQVADVAERTGCTMLLLRHLNKAGAGSPMYRGGGSIGIVGAARAGFLVAPDPEDEGTRVLACIKNNLAPEPPSLAYRLEAAPGSHVAQVVWVGESQRGAVELLRPAEDDDERNERDEAVEWLLAYLTDRGGAAPAGDVLKAASRDGVAKTTLHKARKRAGVTTAKAGMQGGWTWRHPEDSAEGSQDSRSHEPEPSEPSGNLRSASDQAGEACVGCGQPLLLRVAGRDTCDRCRKEEQ